jgi:hypothetical protein
MSMMSSFPWCHYREKKRRYDCLVRRVVVRISGQT